jgi:hypothetical protein
MGMSGDIFLNIDTIVLRGLQHIDRYALTEALQQALIEQLATNHKLRATDLSRVKTNISLPGEFNAAQLGHTLGLGLSNIFSGNPAPQETTDKASRGGHRHG